MYSKIFDRLSFLSLFLVITLLPFFFLPFTKIPVETSKGLLLVVGLVLSIIFWVLARFFDGKVVLPKSWILVSGFGIVLVFFLSAILSANNQVSLFGEMFDIGSFWFIFCAFILMLMSAIIFRTTKEARIVLLGIILSSTLVLIFQSVHLFIPAKLSLGILIDKTDNILGSWNALGLFAGFACLIFLLVVEFFSISKIKKILLGLLILLSVLLIAAVNFSLVWILLGISSLFIFAYKVSVTLGHHGDEEKKKHFPIFSFFVVTVSLLFFLNPLVYISKGGDSQYLGNIIPGRLNIENIEFNPSLPVTMSITKGVILSHPVLGIGPNRFIEAWSMYKPNSLNNTIFWDVSFNSGSGLLPTMASTTGSLGIIALLTFFVLLMVAGARSIFSSIKNSVNWETMAFFVLSLYLFISAFFYSAGSVIFLLAFAFTGVFVGLSVRNNKNEEISLSFLNDSRKTFFSMLLIILLVIVSLSGAFKYIERFASVSYFKKAVAEGKAGNIEAAESSINKALALHVNDLYLRTYSEVYLMKLISLLGKGESLADPDKALLQPILEQSIKGAGSAINYNPKNYLNFQALGSLYQNLGSFGVKDTNAQAIESYSQASALNPNNPRLKLSMAIISFADKNTPLAKEYGNAALSLKPNYVDALIVLSQIARSEGDNALSLSYAQNALSVVPGNQDLIKYVDALKNGSPSPVTPPVDVNPSPSTSKTKQKSN